MLWFLKDLSTTKNHQSGLNNHLSWGGSHLNHHPDFSSRPLDFVIKQPQHHLIGVQNCRCNPEKLRVSSTRTAQFIRKKQESGALFVFFLEKKRRPNWGAAPIWGKQQPPNSVSSPVATAAWFPCQFYTVCMDLWMDVSWCIYVCTYVSKYVCKYRSM